jgi:RNA polymerase sigma factor (sigma-70 family)
MADPLVAFSGLTWLFGPASPDDTRSGTPAVRQVIAPSTSAGLLTLAPDLVARLQARDEAAFDEVLTSAGARLVSFAASIVGSRDVAEDIVQDVLLGIWRRGTAFDPHGAPLAHWLFTATRHTALSWLRSETRAQRRARRAMEEQPVVTIDDDSPWDEELAALRRALETLTEHQRTAFTLRYGHDLTIAEIAGLLGITQKGAERLFTRIGKLLREHIGAK